MDADHRTHHRKYATATIICHVLLCYSTLNIVSDTKAAGICVCPVSAVAVDGPFL